ncbi:hypothetical protein CHARACLAT_010620 [Characodon lateralis]|uniref:Uncharacterized protein n=1 Tax=Characodon lateralis TaxID=208331 RepID=A0ABU7E3I5_9TELE|nr:hypothetical protein [Characodon lateralis]
MSFTFMFLGGNKQSSLILKHYHNMCACSKERPWSARVGENHKSSLSVTGAAIKQRRLHFPLPRHLIDLLWGKAEAFLGQLRDIVPPTWTVPWSSSWWNVPETPSVGGTGNKCTSHLN